MFRLDLPRVYPIVDTASLARCNVSPLAMSEALIEAGAKILQFRHKEPWTEQTYQQAKQISIAAREAEVTFVLNDRADYAALLGAAVHVGQEDLPPAAVRRVIGNGGIGFSTHNREQLERGDSEDVDYLALGPIYQTNSKVNADPAVGLDGLRVLRPSTQKPLVAIGGITLENARQVVEAGADSVALIGALLPSEYSRVAIRNRAEEWINLLS